MKFVLLILLQFGALLALRSQSLPGNTLVPVCTGQNKKLINGVCETGTKALVNQEPVVKNNEGYCRLTYKISWSDGSSIEYTEDRKGACQL
ncbi:hypothetical protein HHL17_14460 [Chitinophaga sp. G-6-1-13]|uniref:Uncharacterized protein n=1 Tax=Chitinophaga fulva TaxID=2728842 RepID=A0A848GKI1_9BACT|nr:hypothetical protein [Chitinophaga fulva]NML38407.1 hypothetical protein [Chitinophaga fulva]